MLATPKSAAPKPVTSKLVTLKRRSEFLRIRGGARWSSDSFVIEGKRRARAGETPLPAADVLAMDSGPPRFGFTVTKKLGAAVVRNRIRRRLREAVRQSLVGKALEGCDYVIIARDGALRRPAQELRDELLLALDKVNRKLGASRR